ncbi:MAG: N-acetyltransferase, partial [Clostridia bacterium]|nr:N-acetyltransferase [Clostridia bacterium]
LQAQSWWREEDEPTDYHFWFRPVDLKADLDTFLSFGAEFAKNAYGDISKFDPEKFVTQSLCLQREYPRALLFAMLRNRECGLLRLDVSGNGDLEGGLIKTVIVNEKLRGRGYAPQLLGEAVSIFRRMGKKYIAVNVAEGNERAMGFYRKDDFYRKGEIPGHIVMQKKIEIVNPYRQ